MAVAGRLRTSTSRCRVSVPTRSATTWKGPAVCLTSTSTGSPESMSARERPNTLAVATLKCGSMRVTRYWSGLGLSVGTTTARSGLGSNWENVSTAVPIWVGAIPGPVGVANSRRVGLGRSRVAAAGTPVRFTSIRLVHSPGVTDSTARSTLFIGAEAVYEIFSSVKVRSRSPGKVVTLASATVRAPPSALEYFSLRSVGRFVSTRAR